MSDFGFTSNWTRRGFLGAAGLLSLAARRSRGQQGIDATRRMLRVGPGRTLGAPSAAAALARDGDVVDIDAGTYTGDVAVWRANNLILRATGGRAHLDAQGNSAQAKATWVIKGDDTLVEGIEFSGARAPGHNGAGIRQEGVNLTVRNCRFHDNEEGILCGAIPRGDILIEHSEFARNGHPDGQAHNLYIGHVRSLTLRYCYVHHAITGSNVKSRARVNRIVCNRIMDESDGAGNYNIDLSNGGRAYVAGNLLQQSPWTGNFHLVAFAPEGPSNPDQRLYLVNNTLVNDRHNAIFVMNRGGTVASVFNNVFVGAGDIVDGPALLAGNLVVRDDGLAGAASGHGPAGDETLGGLAGSGGNRLGTDPGFRDRADHDYRLRADSAAVDIGVAARADDGEDLVPRVEYVHPAGVRRRAVSGAPDAGAYEWSSDAS